MGASQTFDCCCSIELRHFEIKGHPTIEIVNCVLAAVTSLAATIGNLLVLVSFWRTPSLFTPSNVLLLSLALTDLGVGLVAAPLFFVSCLAKISKRSELYCSIAPAVVFASYSLCSISLSTLTTISMERYIALRLHLRYREIVTIKRVFALSVAIWVAGLMYGCLSTWAFSVAAPLSVVVIPSCCFVSVAAYCAIYRVLRRHQAQIGTQISTQQDGNSGLNLAQYKKFFVSMILIYCVFLLCFIPILVLNAISLTGDEGALTHSASDLAESLVFMNSTLDPIVYCWRFPTIRAAVKETIRKLFPSNNSERWSSWANYKRNTQSVDEIASARRRFPYSVLGVLPNNNRSAVLLMVVQTFWAFVLRYR